MIRVEQANLIYMATIVIFILLLFIEVVWSILRIWKERTHQAFTQPREELLIIELWDAPSRPPTLKLSPPPVEDEEL